MQKRLVMIWWWNLMQTGLLMLFKEKQQRLILQAQRKWRSLKLGCQEAGYSCSIFIRSRISGQGSSSSRSPLFRQLLEYFGIQQKYTIKMGEDKRSSIKFFKNPVMHKRRKYNNTNFHFIRDKTEGGTTSIYFIPTDKIAADFFKKFLPYQGWKGSEQFWWEQTLCTQFKSEWWC